MLDIPESVAALFSRDSIRKNFRAVFESGRPDLTNADIMAESLHFSESICSRDSMTFGTAEDSVLEFETIGVENLLGQRFTAYIEIDATSLPEELQTIREDLTYPVYPVPLGKFIVASCRRNHELAVHRQVKASSKFGGSSVIPPLIAQVLTVGFHRKRDPISWRAKVSFTRFLQNYGLFDGKLMKNQSTTDTPSLHHGTFETFNPRSPNGSLYYYTGKYADSTNAILSIAFFYATNGVRDEDLKCETDTPPCDLDDARVDIVTDGVLDLIYDGGRIRADGEDISREQLSEVIKPIISEQFQRNRERGFFIQRTYRLIKTSTGGGSSYAYDEVRTANTTVNVPCVDIAIMPPSSAYQFGGSRTAEMLTAVAPCFGGASATKISEHQVWLPETESVTITNYRHYPVTIEELVAETDEVLSVPDDSDPPYYDSDLTPLLAQTQTILSGLAECMGGFIIQDRFGNSTLRYLSTEPVATLTPSQYSSCWADEFSVEPIGKIHYKFHDEDKEYVFGDGQSIYTVNSMDFLDKIGEFSEDTAKAFFDRHLVPTLQGLYYIPVEIDAVNVPYLEAGDCIDVELADGEKVQTYILERNMNGIQHLADSIVADGITEQDIIENEIS